MACPCIGDQLIEFSDRIVPDSCALHTFSFSNNPSDPYGISSLYIHMFDLIVTLSTGFTGAINFAPNETQKTEAGRSHPGSFDHLIYALCIISAW